MSAPLKMEPTCVVQALCGGCPALHLPRSSELTAKLLRVVQAFRSHDLQLPLIEPVCTASRSHYRNRLRVAVRNGRATFFNQAKRHGCPALRPELWLAIENLRTATAADPTVLSGVDFAEVRIGDDPGLVGLSLGCRPRLEQVAEQEVASYDRLAAQLGPGWLVAHRDVAQQPTLSYSLGEGLSSQNLTIEVPIDAFVQVNSDINRLLVSHVRDAVMQAGHNSFIDLFAGAGNLSVPLIDAGLNGIAVERSGSAINTLSQRFDGAAGDLDTWAGDVQDCLPLLKPADVVICNPPRTGIKTGHASIAKLAGMVICVGCDAESLAYDAAQFVSQGLSLRSLRSFDMFPGTNHIETVAVLS